MHQPTGFNSRTVVSAGSIHYFVVEWDADNLAWADFRGSLLGPTDPAAAPPDSIRGLIYAAWEKLGLAAKPNTGDNGVHASASPFEGLAEKMNWLEIDPSEVRDASWPMTDLYTMQDAFGAHILANGLSAAMLKEWVLDPVTFSQRILLSWGSHPLSA